MCLLLLMTTMCYQALTLFFFNHTATTVIYTLSLHDALPIFVERATNIKREDWRDQVVLPARDDLSNPDRKSTRLNSSHPSISYAVFCLKKKTTSFLYHIPEY